METRAYQINNYLNRGIIESNIEFSLTQDVPLSVVKFGYDVDLEDGYFFKDLISFIHSYSDFNTILQQPNDTFLIFLRDCKIHQAKAIVTKMSQQIKNKFKIDIPHIGITILDESDTYKSLLDRLDSYFVMSKLSSKPKTFYGTLDFDFYETQDDKKVLENIFKKMGKTTLYNFYKGLPVTEKVKIIKFEQGSIMVKIDPIKLAFFEKEDFTYIQHDLIPNVIKASIMKIDPNKLIMVLGKLEFLDTSPVERSGIRVEPEHNIFASVSHNKKKLLEGTVVSLSENSIVLSVKPETIKTLHNESLWNLELTAQFQIPTKKSFLTTVITKATIFSILNDKIVINMMPSNSAKSKLRNYISIRQGDVLSNLRLALKLNKKV